MCILLLLPSATRLEFDVLPYDREGEVLGTNHYTIDARLLKFVSNKKLLVYEVGGYATFNVVGGLIVWLFCTIAIFLYSRFVVGIDLVKFVVDEIDNHETMAPCYAREERQLSLHGSHGGIVGVENHETASSYLAVE